MSKRIWLIALGMAVIGLMAGGMASASGRSVGAPVGPWGRGTITPHGSAQSAPAGAQVITVITQPTQFKFVDADDSGGLSVGDYEVFTEDVLDAATHKQVGVDHAKCFIDFDAFLCDGTFTLFGRGDIAVEGSLTATGNLLAVTGGTGEFLDNGGEAINQNLPSGRTMFTFFLT